MNRRNLLLGGAGALTTGWMPLVGLSGCAASDAPIRVAINDWIGYALMFLAREEGHLAESTARLIEFPSNTASMLALANREVMAAALTLDEVLLAREGGLDIRVVLVFDESNGADALLAVPSIQNLSDLRGKRLGIESSAVGALMLSRLLEAADLQPADVFKVPLTADQHVSAYESGEVDAVITFEPMASQLRAAGANTLFDSSRLPGLIVDVLAVHAETVASSAPQIRALLRGYFLAMQHLRDQPRGAAVVLGRQMFLSPDAVEQALRGITLPDLEENRRWLGGSAPHLMEASAKVSAVMQASSLLRQAPSLVGVCEPSFLPEGAST